MSCQLQVETWLYYGIADLYFSFDCDYIPFDYHALFFSIMALEKHMKAQIIAARKSEFVGLDERAAGLKSIEIAKEYSHNFTKMAAFIEKTSPRHDLRNVFDSEVQTYKGRKLLSIMQDAYMEVRYPPAKGVHLQFPAGKKGEGIYLSPLGSTALPEFIRQSCEKIVIGLRSEIDVNRLLKNVESTSGRRESFGRFKQAFLSGQWSGAL